MTLLPTARARSNTGSRSSSPHGISSSRHQTVRGHGAGASAGLVPRQSPCIHASTTDSRTLLRSACCHAQCHLHAACLASLLLACLRARHTSDSDLHGYSVTTPTPTPHEHHNLRRPLTVHAQGGDAQEIRRTGSLIQFAWPFRE